MPRELLKLGEVNANFVTDCFHIVISAQMSTVVIIHFFFDVRVNTSIRKSH
jgi:hypothetical protein